jgi:3D (Asp-Asp-Asp) domain-containing protein
MLNIVSMVLGSSWIHVTSVAFSRMKDRGRAVKHVFSKHMLDLSIGLVLLGIVGAMSLSSPRVVDEAFLASLPDEETTQLLIAEMQNEAAAHGELPRAALPSPKRTLKIPLTAYTSDVAQTDSTPCITASGLDVCERDIENVVAANFLPMGTRVRIPELYGDRVFYVEDRMNARYYYKMDVWMKDITDARQFGVQYATVEIF